MINYKLLVLLLVAGFLAQSALAQQKPNILFLVSDDQSVPDLSCYGSTNVKTPNIDKIAKEGMLFNRMYVASPQCTPSRAAFMAGRSVVDIRMTRFAAPLPRDVISFPEVLRKLNYYTGICGRTYHLDGPGNSASNEAKQVFKDYNLITFKDRVDYLRTGPDKIVYDQVTEFLNQVPRGKPFFLQANFSNPHRPWTAPAKYNPDPAGIKIPNGMPDTKEVRNDLSTLYGEINQLDEYVGMLLSELDKRGLTKNTMVVFIGDNGAAVLRGKGTLYEKGINVPFAVRWPGHIKNTGTLSNALLSGEDIGPSFIELAGGTPLKEMTGKSFLPILTGKATEGHDYVFSERGPHGFDLPRSTAPFDLGRTVVNKRYKLVYNALWQLPYDVVDFGGQLFWKELKDMAKNNTLEQPYKRLFFSEKRPMFELFDLEKDPTEIENLFDNAAYATQQQELLAQLNKWMILNQDYLPLPIKVANNKKE